MTPLLEFKEIRSNYGIKLVGTVNLNGSVTIPNYESHSIDKRKTAESYILQSINDDFIRLRGYYKLIEALNELRMMTATRESDVAKKVLMELIDELKEPQFILKGDAQ